MEQRNSFVLYADYRQHLDLLTDDEAGKLIKAVFDYQCGDVPNLSGPEKIAFSFIKAQLDRDNEKYIDTCRKRREAGKKGGRPSLKPDGFSAKPKKANGLSEKQSKAKKPDNDTDNENDTDRDIDRTFVLNTFEQFWTVYPRKEAKARALKSWQKIKPDAALLETIISAVKKQAIGRQWIEGFIPHASTWLNGERWKDEVPPPAKEKPNAPIQGSRAYIAPEDDILLKMANGGRPKP